MSIVPFSQELAQQLFDSSEDHPVRFDLGWQWLEYSRKDSAKRFFMSCGFVEGVDYRLHNCVESAPSGGLTHREDIYLSCECFKQWAMMSGTPKGKEVRMYFLECERIAKQAIKQSQVKTESEPKPTLSLETAQIIVFLAQKAGCDNVMAAQIAMNGACAINPALLPAKDEFKVAIACTKTEDDTLLNATQVGAQLGINARATNILLISKGLQYKTDEKLTPYRPTKAGEQYSRMVPATAKSADQTVYQLRWRKTVLEALAEALA